MIDDSLFKSQLAYFNRHKGEKITEWLNFDKFFTKCGIQGVAGILKDKKDRSYVFKFSKKNDHLIEHEQLIMSSLNELSSFCPHFCRTFGILSCEIAPKHSYKTNPFKASSKDTIIKKDVIIQELIDGVKFSELIRNRTISEEILLSIVKQILLAILIAQNEKYFVHNDLHSNNIIIKQCNSDALFLYVLDADNQFCIPTFGYYPIIIDYGFSYCGDMEDKALLPTLIHTEAGFMSNMFDRFSDFKMFLISTIDEINIIRPSEKTKELWSFVKKIFKPLNVDFKTGWDNIRTTSVTETITDFFYEVIEEDDSIFYTDGTHCVDIIQSLIILPLEPTSVLNSELYFKAFFKEWRKIEKELGSVYYNLYILKCVIDLARELRPAYLEKERREEATLSFQRGIFIKVDEISKFCMLKEIKFEQMLCALYNFTGCLEGMMYSRSDLIMSEKESEYSRMSVKDNLELYSKFELLYPHEYNYTTDSKIIVQNGATNQTGLVELVEENIEKINSLLPICVAPYIYDKLIK